MTTSMIRWIHVLLVFVLVTWMFPTHSLAQDGTQTFTTLDGLSFDYPDGWQAQGSVSQVLIGSTENALSRRDLRTGDVYAIVLSGDNTAAMFGHFDNVETAAETVSAMFTAGVEDLVQAVLTVNGNPAIRYDFQDEVLHSLMIFIDIDGQFVTVIAATLVDEFVAQEGSLLAIVETMRYETVGTSDGDTTVPPTAESETTIVWQRHLENSNNIFEELGTLLMVATNGETIYLSDSANIVQMNSEGNIVDFRPTDGQHFYECIAADSDGSIWAGTFGEDVFMHFAENGSILSGWNNDDFDTPIFSDVIGVQDLILGQDGNLYLFTTRFDAELNAKSYVLVWNTAGEFLHEFLVSDMDEAGNQRFISDTYLSATPEGNILLMDRYGSAKVVDSEGNTVTDFPAGMGQSIYVVNDAVVGLDGSIYVASYDGIHRLGPDGSAIQTFGTTQNYATDPPEFEPGQFSELGPTALAVMSDGDILAVDRNEKYNLIVRIDFGGDGEQ